jgi:hypothetical protein
MEVIEVVEREVEVIEILERGLVGPTGPVGPQANINYTVVSSSQTVTNRQMIAADTSGGSFTLTLPSNPAAGDAIDIFDYSDTFDTNPLTIARNGQNIEGLADDLVANVEGAYFTLIFTGGSRGWQVVPRYGVSGLQNVLTTEGDLIYRGASAETRLGIGTAGQILKVNSGATAPEWGNEVMSSADKTKLDGIAAGAEVNVNADWNAVSGDAQILNKPATFTPSSHTHGSITNDGKIGSVSGLPVVTTTAGAVTTLALGTANQVLRVNSGATGVEFGAGFDAASPPAIGNTTPNSGAFTTISATGAVTGAVAANTSATSGCNGFQIPVPAAGGSSAVGLYAAFTSGSARAVIFGAGTSGSTTTIADFSASGLVANSIQNTPIGSTTRNTGAFTTLTANNGIPLAASAPVLNLSQTWNNAAVAFTGMLLNVTNTNSVATSYYQEWQEGGVTQAAIRVGGFLYLRSGRLASPVGAGWAESAAFLYNAQARINSTSILIGSGGTGAGAAGVTLSTEGGVEHVLALRNAANPQTFRLYGQITGSDVSATGNYERGYMRWSAAGGVFQIGTEKGSGGGSARALELQTDGATRWTLTSTGQLTGASGRGIYSHFQGGFYIWSASPTTGIARFYGDSGHTRISSSEISLCLEVPRLTFNGTTNAFPALKRSSTALQVRLADDTGFAPLSAGLITATGNLVLTDNDGAQTATFDAQSKLTANRTYDLPNASGTLALTSDIPSVSKNLWIPASAWIPKTTAGCGVDSRETSTNDQNFDELLFDTGSDEFADALVVMPSNYNNGTVTARFYWTAASGSGGVAWAIQGRAFANDDALDTAAGTAQLVTDTLIAANDMHVTSATSAVTIGGTPAANTPIQFTIYRDVSDAADTLGVDARLLGVEIIFN